MIKRKFITFIFKNENVFNFSCQTGPNIFYETFYGGQGLQEKIKLVPIDLQNRPAWYKEKVYPANKVMLCENENENENFRVCFPWHLKEEIHPSN